MRNHYGSFFSNVNAALVQLPKKIKNNLLFTIQKDDVKLERQEWIDTKRLLSANSKYRYINREWNPYNSLTLTALEIWKTNVLFGNGIRSFRIECHRIVSEQKRGLCSSHPHNYYFEILTDTGIAGFILTMGIALIFIFYLVKNYKAIKNQYNLENLFLLAATISLFLEAFPFKSTGSFFTTYNTTYIILMASIVMCYKKLLERKNFG